MKVREEGGKREREEGGEREREIVDGKEVGCGGLAAMSPAMLVVMVMVWWGRW